MPIISVAHDDRDGDVVELRRVAGCGYAGRLTQGGQFRPPPKHRCRVAMFQECAIVQLVAAKLTFDYLQEQTHALAPVAAR